VVEKLLRKPESTSSSLYSSFDPSDGAAREIISTPPKDAIIANFFT
jgi:hypothetical protein